MDELQDLDRIEEGFQHILASIESAAKEEDNKSAALAAFFLRELLSSAASGKSVSLQALGERLFTIGHEAYKKCVYSKFLDDRRPGNKELDDQEYLDEMAGILSSQNKLSILCAARQVAESHGLSNGKKSDLNGWSSAERRLERKFKKYYK